MIPAGLSAAHAALNAWKHSVEEGGPNPLRQLNDEDLGDVYRVLSSLAHDVDDAHGAARDLLVRRLMATKAAGGGAGPTEREGVA